MSMTLSISQFNVPNGFVGMNKFVFRKLCMLFWDNCEAIRAMFGINAEYLALKKNRLFLRSRMDVTLAKFRSNQNPRLKYIFSFTPSGPQCTILSEYNNTIFVDPIVSKGIFQWVVRIKYGVPTERNPDEMWIGAAFHKRLYETNIALDTYSLGSYPDTWGFGFWKYLDGRLKSSLFGVKNSRSSDIPLVAVPDGSLVAVEADGEACTLCFFVNKKKVPRMMTRIHFPLHFGVSGSRGAAFASVGFRRLPLPTPSTVVCTLHEDG